MLFVQGERITQLCYGKYKSLSSGRAPPTLRTHESIQQDAHEASRAAALPSARKGETVHSRGVTGFSSFSKLPYFDMATMTMLDMMHLASGVIGKAHLIGALTGDRLMNARAAQRKAWDAEHDEHYRLEQVLIKKKEKLEKEKQKLSDADSAILNNRKSKGRKVNQASLDAEERRVNEMVAVRRKLQQCEADIEAHERNYQLACDRRPPAIGKFVDNWHIHPAKQAMIETHAYSKIFAPPGIAPRYKQPLSMPSQMTSHQWLGFIRVYGKYVFAQAFKDDNLAVLCDIIDLVKGCLLSQITPTVIDTLRALVKKVASHMHSCFPASEWSIVSHLLTFHMVDTIDFWGPARSYWCFPFERSVFCSTHKHQRVQESCTSTRIMY